MSESCLACLDGDHGNHTRELFEHGEKLEDFFCVCDERST
jgi:hypothetical protein